MANTNTNNRNDSGAYIVIRSKTNELEGTFRHEGAYVRALNYAITLAEVEYNQGDDGVSLTVIDEDWNEVVVVGACRKI